MRNVAVLKAFFDRLLAPHGPQLGESIGAHLMRECRRAGLGWAPPPTNDQRPTDRVSTHN